VHIDIPKTLERASYRYPAFLVDAVVDFEPGHRMVAVKNVSVSEEFFQGHFPGTPLMPGVLMIEAFTQVASLLLLQNLDRRTVSGTFLRGVDQAKFRRQVVPGDQLTLEVVINQRKKTLVRVTGTAYIEGSLVAEAKLLIGIKIARTEIASTAVVHSSAQLGEGTVVEPYAIIGEHVRLGRRCRVGSSAVIDGWTTMGDDNEIFPFATIGLVPQDLKFKGEFTRLVIGDKNIFREFVTIHRGTKGGGEITEIGDNNVFMAYVHVAHDCRIGRSTILANGATLAGHVLVDDYATVGAFSGVHQFCRVGRHSFIGGYSVVTKDALPFGTIVGNRARIYGLNTVGLTRRGFSADVITQLKRTYRYLLNSKLNTSRALLEIDADETLTCADVRYLVDFIRTSERGVTLRRTNRRIDRPVIEMMIDDS